MNASIATALPGSQRSTHVGPPPQSTPSDPGRTRSVPALGPDVERSGGPSRVLARCVGDVDEFAARAWGRHPFVNARGRRADAFADVFSLDLLDELVALGIRVPAVRMIADGEPLPASRFCSATRLGGRDLDDVVDPVKVAARLVDGATLVMQSLHRTCASVGAFVSQLQDELSHPVQANAYLTPPSAVGLAEHSDRHDVLAVQLHGSKRWWVEGLGDVTMLPGDVMYVPRGVRHRAATSSETSLHLTLGIIRVTARQVLNRMLDTGPESLDDPLPIGYRHRGGRDRLERSLDTVLESALDMFGSADLGAIADHEQSRRLSRPPAAGRILSNVRLDELGAHSVIRWVVPEPLARAIDDTDRDLHHWDGLRDHHHWSPEPTVIEIHVGHRTLTVPTAALEALRALSDGLPVRVGDLPGLDEPSRVVIARRLVREGACIVDTFD